MSEKFLVRERSVRADLQFVIPYEQDGETFTPVTIHATTRQQIKFRLKTGRFKL